MQLFRQIADAFVLAHFARRHVENERVPFGGEEQAEQQLDCGGLPGAIGSEQAEYFAAVDFHVEGAQSDFLFASPEVAVDLGKFACFDDEFFTGHASATSS